VRKSGRIRAGTAYNTGECEEIGSRGLQPPENTGECEEIGSRGLQPPENTGGCEVFGQRPGRGQGRRKRIEVFGHRHPMAEYLDPAEQLERADAATPTDGIRL
jgi:hypothetical protein